MATKIEICNLALSNLGTGKVIASIDERSEEARVLKTYYDTTLEAVCRDFTWNFTKRFKKLALVEENPTSEWAYSYRLPNDCLLLRRILSGNRNDTALTLVPYILSYDTQGKLLFTDMVDAEIEYVLLPVSETFFPSDFALAFSYRLAYYIAPRITGGNAFTGLKKDMQDSYMRELAAAKRTSANEVQQDQSPDSEFIIGRL